MHKVWQIEDDPRIRGFDYWAFKYLCGCKALHIKRAAVLVIAYSVLSVIGSIIELIVNEIDEWSFENILRIAVIPIEVFCTVWLYQGLKQNLRQLLLPYIFSTLLHGFLYAYLAQGEITGYSEKKGDAHDFAVGVFNFFQMDGEKKTLEERRVVILIFACLHIAGLLIHLIFLPVILLCYRYLWDREKARALAKTSISNGRF